MKWLRTTRGLLGLTALIAVYLATGFGGYRAHLKELASEGQRKYARVAKDNWEEAKWAAEHGATPFQARLHEGGPHSGIQWCLPILPGVLLVDSWMTIGPLYGGGGTKIVIFYGLGSFTLCELWGWRA